MNTDARVVPIFRNASAGLRSPSIEQVRVAFGDAADLIAVEPHQLAAAVTAAIERGAPIIGVAGGDGSLQTAARALVGTNTALLCVPTGTINNFARRLGILSIDDAAAALRSARIESIAVGSVQDDIFLNTLTLGEYARVVRLRERIRRFIGKWPGAGVAFAVAAGSSRTIDVSLVVEGETIHRRTRLIWVGIGWGSFPRVHASLERRSHPDLEVAILHTDTRRQGVAFLFRLAKALIRNTGPVRDRDLEVLQARSLTIKSLHRIDATADGETIRLQAPVDLGVRDDALRVVAGDAGKRDSAAHLV